MTPEVEIPYSSVESITVTIETPVDPTAAAPEFRITSGFTPDPGPSGWSDGAWSVDGYDAATGRVTATSPNIGASESLAIDQGKAYSVWMRWTAGDDTPVRRVVELRVV